MNIFDTFLVQPIFNALVFLYNIIPGRDIGIAIIILTVLIRLILSPLSRKSLKSQKALQELQPKVDEVRKKYKDDPVAQSREMMNVYKQSHVNPASSCLPLLIQFPFLIAVFQVFRDVAKPESLSLLYSFVANPGTIDKVAFGIPFFDLAEKNWLLAILAGVAQFYQSKMLMHKTPPKVPGAKDEGVAAIMNKQMMYILPAITVFFGFTFPGGLTLYWLVTTLVSIAEQKLVFKK